MAIWGKWGAHYWALLGISKEIQMLGNIGRVMGVLLTHVLQPTVRTRLMAHIGQDMEAQTPVDVLLRNARTNLLANIGLAMVALHQLGVHQLRAVIRSMARTGQVMEGQSQAGVRIHSATMHLLVSIGQVTEELHPVGAR